MLAICSVVKAEMFYGAAKSQRPEATRQLQEAFFRRFISYDFDDIAAREYAVIRAHLESMGLPIGPNDVLIAAIALANDLTLVTRNLGEFTRVPHLRIERVDVV